MKLVVGLGNPGPKYETTRHNAGFLMVDMLLEEARGQWDPSQKYQADVAKADLLGEPCVMLKPQTFMNRSGRSVGEIMRFFKLTHSDLIVIYDDIDVPAGKVKARVGGGHGGHNGIRSIMEETGSGEFHRIKLGVGRPPESMAGMEVSDWVLGRMTDAELMALQGSMLEDVKLRLKGIFAQKAPAE